MPRKFTTFITLVFIFFIAAPRARAEEAPSFSFAVMGCAHMGVCDPGDFELAAKKIKEQAPDFVVFLGGMVEAFRAEEVERAWRKFDAIAASLEVPVYNATSDCSLNPLSASSGTIGLSGQMYSARHKERFYSFGHMNNLFIVLDSADKGRPDGKDENDVLAEQADFLKATLERARGRDNIFVFQNRTPPEDSVSSPWFRLIHPLLIGKVRYVFTASAHYFDLKKCDGVNYVTAGVPPCQQNQMERTSFFNFLMVTVAAGKVSVNVVPVGRIPVESLGGAQKKSASSKYGKVKPDTLNAAERRVMAPPDAVARELGIKPGMKVLDVGAGMGFFTFAFADALAGTGRVFATDIDPVMIGSLERTAKEKGYKNVTPVKVSAEGVDPFYKNSRFDIIFLAEMYHYLWRPVDYFRELRRSLAPGTGRLYIIHFKNVYDFDEIEFDDFTPILKRLKKLEDGSPFFKKAAAGIENYARNWQGGEIPPSVRKTIIANFNGLLSDRYFLNELLDSYQAENDDMEWVRGKPVLKALNTRDVQLAKWLIAELDERGVFDKEKPTLTKDEEEHLRALNRLLLIGAFGIDKINYLKGTYNLYVGKNRLISDMEAAGYKFVREHGLFTYYHFLEFKNDGD